MQLSKVRDIALSVFKYFTTVTDLTVHVDRKGQAK